MSFSIPFCVLKILFYFFILQLSHGCSHDDDFEVKKLNSLEDGENLVIYSSRKEHLIQPLFEKFTSETGIKIDYVTDKAGVLIERIKIEGRSTNADLLLTVDAGNLGYASALDIFQPINSSIIKNKVPYFLRDKNDLWTGLSLRARTIVYSTERVNSEELSSYQNLADPFWKKRLCLRTSKKVYNQSLIATKIAQQGEDFVEKMVSSWVSNLAIPPTSNDTKVMEAIVSGQCDVGIVNTYYFARLQEKDPSIPLALFFPNQNTKDALGVHVNVSGIGITKFSKNTNKAKLFIDWLISDEAQTLFAALNKEYPVSDSLDIHPQVKSWGEFTISSFPLSEIYRYQPAAVKLMDRAGYK